MGKKRWIVGVTQNVFNFDSIRLVQETIQKVTFFFNRGIKLSYGRTMKNKIIYSRP